MGAALRGMITAGLSHRSTLGVEQPHIVIQMNSPKVLLAMTHKPSEYEISMQQPLQSFQKDCMKTLTMAILPCV